MKRLFLALSATACLMGQSPANANDSAYTDLDLKHCNTLVEQNPDEPGGDFFSVQCEGYKGYPVIVKEGDLRASVAFGHLSKLIVDEGFETFSPFNSTGNKIEWRLDDKGVPRAAILRFFLQNTNQDTGEVDPKVAGQVLAVYKVGQKDDPVGCMAGIVDALENPDANELARTLADGPALSYDCTTGAPAYAGKRGPYAAEPSINFPTAN